jgi:hypothetical protein
MYMPGAEEQAKRTSTEYVRALFVASQSETGTFGLTVELIVTPDCSTGLWVQIREAPPLAMVT